MNWREVIYDQISNLKQVYDDMEIEEFQVGYWVSYFVNMLVAQHSAKEFDRTGHMSGRFLTIFPSIKVETAEHNDTNTPKGRKFIRLPGEILDFDYDRGVSYISYNISSTDNTPSFASVTFQRTTPGTAARLYGASFEEPKSDNPYFYTVGMDKIFFLGLEGVTIETVEAGLHMAVSPYDITDLDTPCPLPAHLYETLNQKIMNLGMFVLNVPEDRINDGNNEMVMPRGQKPMTQTQDQDNEQ
jgi:hypothetical protein